MNGMNVVNDTQQTVVGSATTGGDKTGTPVNVTNAESAVRTQSREENSGFRKLRLENEQYRRELESLRERAESATRLERENKAYLESIISERMKRDLEAIRALDPSVQTLDSLGNDFIGLIEHGIDAKIAYRAIKGATDGKESQPRTGAVGVSGGVQDSYYSSKELDRLTARDLENPAIYKKAMESLKRL